MEPSNKTPARKASRSNRARGARSGKITLVTIIAILGLIVLAGFVGNAGHVVTAKVASQNAADAIGLSSAQWMARGMNAVTATNHLLGEVTGLVVVVEGLGGPEADLQMEDYPPQSQIPDKVNRQLADMAYIRGNPIYGTEVAGKFDKILVESIVKKLVSKEGDDAKHKAFATIFDSKLVLKKAVTKRLLVKFFANWLFLVPPPWGYLSAAGAYITHGVADVQLVEIGIEYVILHGLEKLVTTGGVMKKLKVDLLEDKLIPAIAAHGDFLAGRPTKGAKNRPSTESGVVNNAVRDTLEHLGEVYGVDAAIYPTATTYPAIANLRMPIEAESPPSGKGTPEGKDEPEWGNDDLATEDKDDQLQKVFDEINEKKAKIRKRIEQLRKQVEVLKGLDAEVDDLKSRTGVTPPETTAFNEEKKKIAANIAEKEKLIQERIKDLQKLEAEEKQMRETIASLEQAPPGSGNISANRAHLALAKMSQAEERTTQWVRATYPYVDGFRSPILKLFEEHLERSGAADHFKKWTNRYTLTKAWKFRSGFRFTKVSGQKNKGEWKKDANVEPLQMYLMVETFDPKVAPAPRKPGAPRVRKGDEVWTKDTTDGKKMAEEMFTLVAMTQREMKPLFSPVIYPIASKNGMTTFAQAIYYNGNTQQQAPTDNPNVKSTIQPKVGWDTLNWDPIASPPEWGAPASVSATAKWPWDIFSQDAAFLGKAGAKLNWQAKLMPVTKSRLTPAIPAAVIESREMGENVGWSLLFFDKMITH